MTHNPTPNAPRIALCISGQPRFFEVAFPYIKKNLIDCNPNVDVFLHFWYDEKNVGRGYKAVSDTMKGKGCVSMEKNGTPEKLKELYKPVCMQCEPQEDFSIDAQRFPDVLRDKTNTFGSLSMWTSIYRCNELKRNYEIEIESVYDYTIRMRFDAIVFTKILIKNIEKEFVHGFSPFFDEHGKKIVPLSDQILVSSSKNMDIISNLIKNIFIYLPRIGVWNNEKLLCHHVIKNNILIKDHWNWHTVLIRQESVKSAIFCTIANDVISMNIIRLLRNNKITRLFFKKN